MFNKKKKNLIHQSNFKMPQRVPFARQLLVVLQQSSLKPQLKWDKNVEFTALRCFQIKSVRLYACYVLFAGRNKKCVERNIEKIILSCKEQQGKNKMGLA